MNMDKHKRYVISKELVTSEYKNRAILGNSRTGFWIIVSKDCYDYLVNYIESMTASDFIEMFEDDEDRKIMTNIIESLINIELLIDEHEYNQIRNPEKIYYLLTNRCNLNCKHCCVDANTVFEEELSTEGAKSIIDKVSQINPCELILSGGEPMIRNDFFEILDHAHSHGLVVDLMTNGTLINESNVKRIVECTNSISISVDGIDRETYKIVRGVDCFDKVCESVRLLKENGFHNVSISMVEIVKDRRFVKDFFKLATNLGAVPAIRKYDLDGRGERNYEWLKEKIKDYLVRKYGFDYTEELSREKMLKTKNQLKICNCQAGRTNLTISPSGKLYPCNLLMNEKYCMGNVIKEEGVVDSIIHSRQTVRNGYLEVAQLSKSVDSCFECPVRLFCITCPHQLELFYINKKRFREYCVSRKKPLMDIVWGE